VPSEGLEDLTSRTCVGASNYSGPLPSLLWSRENAERSAKEKNIKSEEVDRSTHAIGSVRRARRKRGYEILKKWARRGKSEKQEQGKAQKKRNGGVKNIQRQFCQKGRLVGFWGYGKVTLGSFRASWGKYRSSPSKKNSLKISLLRPPPNSILDSSNPGPHHLI